jgi:2,4-dienoyl-CoA reductase-like NADH-dependent reductase (Old Yellow Enzyme family)
MVATNGDRLDPLSPFNIPKTNPAPGTLLESSPVKPAVFQPLTIRGLTMKNRLWVSPMCQYSCATGTGIPSDWHLVHLGSFAIHGAGLIMTEASSVLPNGRISPEDVGIWGEEHIAPHKRLTDFAKSQGSHPAIQLAHAGRKASAYAPWETDNLTRPAVEGSDKTHIVPATKGGFEEQVYGPSKDAFSALMAEPREMSLQDIAELKDAFVAAAKRSLQAGYEVIEIHGAQYVPL